MIIQKASAAGKAIAVVTGDEIVISDVQSALDLIANVRYACDCDRIIVHKSLIHEDFFELRTRLAGDILQKLINYHMKIAIVGDFAPYASQSLKDFIYECNKGNDIFFLSTEQEAMDKLAAAR